MLSLVEWLNYHHLLYFWQVARAGSLAQASAELRLAPSTMSGQIRSLEHALGEQLFVRTGRKLVLTDVGRLAYRYADEIFSLGRELHNAVKGRPATRTPTLHVGVSNAVPRLVVRRVLEPALKLGTPLRLVCHEDKTDRLLAALAIRELDVVLADEALGPSLRIRAFSHLLGEGGICFFAAPSLAARYRRGFPHSLDGAPLLLPSEHTGLRRSLERWFVSHEIRPKIVAEFDDRALLREFGQTGAGIFPGLSVAAAETRRQHRVRVVAHVPAVRERFYAMSAERELKHPAVVAIIDQARANVFR